jgi:hypothetical protein
METTYNHLGKPGIFRNDRFWLCGDHVVDPRVNELTAPSEANLRPKTPQRQVSSQHGHELCRLEPQTLCDLESIPCRLTKRPEARRGMTISEKIFAMHDLNHKGFPLRLSQLAAHGAFRSKPTAQDTSEASIQSTWTRIYLAV